MAKAKNGVTKPRKNTGKKKSSGKASTSPKNGTTPKKSSKFKQQSIPGTNIPELEKAAEAYYDVVAERIALQKVESEAKAALEAIVDKLQKEGRLVVAQLGAEERPIYRYQVTDDDGNQVNRKIEEEYTRRRRVRNDKKAQQGR